MTELGKQTIATAEEATRNQESAKDDLYINNTLLREIIATNMAAASPADKKLYNHKLATMHQLLGELPAVIASNDIEALTILTNKLSEQYGNSSTK